MLQGQLVAVEALLPEDINCMYDLLNRHFSGVQPEVFHADLQAKNWCILIRNTSKALVGFSTMLHYSTHCENEPIQVLYSGDTIMDPSAWCSPVLSRTWITAVQQLRQISDYPLYWLLIASGYRTYRFLPTFWQEFYPCYDQPTPSIIQALIDCLARERFGRTYDSQTGIVRLPHPQVLRQRLLKIPVERFRDPHVQFFAERNPGFVQGDELVCLTKMTPENLTRAGQRLWTLQPSLTSLSPVE